MKERLTKAPPKLDKLDCDISASYLAILCLPVVTSIPPVSLLIFVSDGPSPMELGDRYAGELTTIHARRMRR